MASRYRIGTKERDLEDRKVLWEKGTASRIQAESRARLLEEIKQSPEYREAEREYRHAESIGDIEGMEQYQSEMKDMLRVEQHPEWRMKLTDGKHFYLLKLNGIPTVFKQPSDMPDIGVYYTEDNAYYYDAADDKIIKNDGTYRTVTDFNKINKSEETAR